MSGIRRNLRSALTLIPLLTLISCGGGGGGGPSGAASAGGSMATGSAGGSVAPASNVVSVIVDAGPPAANGVIDTLFTTVTICVPGGTECQTIDHIQVDTASYGLRFLAPVLSLTLPVTKASDGNALVECTQFVDGYSWGPVAHADVKVSGETASSVPVQVIGDSNFATVPADCSSSGPTAEDTVAAFGANGILGIGVFEQDCGTGCAGNAANGEYYSCSPTGACVSIAAPLSSQVLNPVPLFATDNNGTIIALPAVASPGAPTATGSLIFGIDTQTNNVSGTQSVLTVDANSGDFTIVFNGQTLTKSFIDSGTNGIFFNDAGLKATACSSMNFKDFYCPPSTQTFTAMLTGVNGAGADATFSVGNAQTILTDNPTFTALPTLAGTYSTSTDTFDWGLPFYFGRRVSTAIESHTTAVGAGPYIGF